jgi:hypothetical protein
MKTRDFFILMVKLFGLYSLAIAIFTYIPSSLSYLVTAFMLEDYTAYLLSLLVVAFILLLVYIMIKKADKIVDLLKIDRGFEIEFIDLGKMSEASIIKIALIILGTYLFVEEIPYFVNATLKAIEVETFPDGNFDEEQRNFVWIFSLLKVFSGLFLMINYKLMQEKLFTKHSNDSVSNPS